MSLEKKVKRMRLKNIVLETVAAAGVIGFAALLPGVFMGMKKLGLLPRKRQEESIKRTRANLIKKGLLEYRNGRLKITHVGRIYLLRHLASRKKTNNKKWDGKWRVLIFDIPEKKRYIREQIRYGLISIGFMRLQDSVWIYPYDCEDLIALIKADMEIGKDVLYMIVDALEHDKPVREYFGLKN